jgi:hypothetical protein
MSTIQGLDWDAYRAHYATMSYAEHQAFHSSIFEQYPEQNHYSPKYAAKAIEQTMPVEVIELGGWDGGLALEMLTLYPTIQTWGNIELCAEAAAHGHQQHPRYFAYEWDEFYWEHGPWHCDLFIASHTIEHLSAYHLERTIAATQARAIYFDAPLLDGPTDWTGSTTSHVLTIGWPQVHEMMQGHGYELDWQEDHATAPHTGGHARACLYLAESE